MAGLEARAFQNMSLGYVEHTSVSGDSWQFITGGVTTSGASKLVVTSTEVASGGSDTYNGRYWIRITSGVNAGLWKRIVDDNGVGAYTLETDADSQALPNNLSVGDAFEIWKSPEPVVVVDSSSGATNMVDSVRAEAASFWVGYYAFPVFGNRKGEHARVTVFSSGTFTLGAGLSGSLGAGDVVVLRKYVEMSDLSDGLEETYNPRPSNRIDGLRGPGSVGPRAGTIGFTTHVHGADTTIATVSQPPPIAGLLKACGFYETKNTEMAVATGGTVAAPLVGTGEWENVSVGSLIQYNAEGRFVQSMTDGGGSDDTINVVPDFSVAPDSGTMNPSTTYVRNRRVSHGDYCGVMLDLCIDGIRTIITGCRGNVSFAGDTVLTAAFELQADHWIRDQWYSPWRATDAYVARAPVLATDRKAWIAGTATNVGPVSFSLNNEVAPKATQGSTGVNGRAGMGHVNAAPGASFRQIVTGGSGEHLPADLLFNASTESELVVVFGASQYGMVAFRIPNAVLIQDPKPEDDSGIIAAPYVVEAHDAGTQTDGGSVVQVEPDFAIGFA